MKTKCNDIITGILIETAILMIIGSCRTEKDIIKLSDTSGNEKYEIFFDIIRKGESMINVKNNNGAFENKISGIMLAAYGSDGKLDADGYFTDVSNIGLSLSGNDNHDIYALANTGKTDPPISEALMKEYLYKIDSCTEIYEKGIPMYGMVEGLNPEKQTRAAIEMTRLFAKVNVSVDWKGLVPKGYTEGTPVLSEINMKVVQCNSRLYPFSGNCSKASMESDIINGQERKANDNGECIFFVPENSQGCLMSGNTDPWIKTPEGLSKFGNKGKSSLCTYIEIACRHSDSIFGAGGTLLYRFYIGKDNTEDFSVEKNCIYNVTLSLTRKGVNITGNWKVTKENDWNDSRKLCFTNGPYSVRVNGIATVMNIFYGFGQTGRKGMKDDGAGWFLTVDENKADSAGLMLKYEASKDVIYATASSLKAIGMKIPVRIETFDNQIYDESTIGIIPEEDLLIFWNKAIEYIAQKGKLGVHGLFGNAKASFHLKDDGSSKILRITDNGDNSCTVSSINSGTATICIRSTYGQSCDVPVHIRKPELSFDQSSVNLRVDGETSSFSFAYHDKNGGIIKRSNTECNGGYFDATLFDECLSLRSTVTAAKDSETGKNKSTGYYEVENRGKIRIKKFMESGIALPYHDDGPDVYICTKAAGYEKNGIKAELPVFIDNPFGNYKDSYDFGKIDDYTLLKGVNLDKEFSGKDKSEIDKVPIIKASDTYIELKAYTDNNWSEKCNSLNLKYAKQGRKESAVIADLTDADCHAAGKVNIRASIMNRYSNEILTKDIGTLEIYIHMAIGGDIIESGTIDSDLMYLKIKDEFAGEYTKVAAFRYLHSEPISRYTFETTFKDGYEKHTENGNTMYYYHLNMGRGIGHPIYIVEGNPDYDISIADTDNYRSSNLPLIRINTGDGIKENSGIFYFEYTPNGILSTGTKDAEGKGYYVIHYLQDISAISSGWLDFEG
ncbi:MAG: DUF4906 domain-containing protein [Bacteroidales bacterium]|nr:DUF4906 domain-containing protein [Bacteroidales bacterium]